MAMRPAVPRLARTGAPLRQLAARVAYAARAASCSGVDVPAVRAQAAALRTRATEKAEEERKAAQKAERDEQDPPPGLARHNEASAHGQKPQATHETSS